MITKLGNVCRVKGGYAFKSTQYSNRGMPLIRIGNITNLGVVLGDICIETANESQFMDFFVSKGDILLALSGATTGKFGVYTSEEVALLNQRVAKIVPAEKIYKNYLYHYMNKLQSTILEKSMGAAQPNISTKTIEELEIFVPDIDYQYKIANILDKQLELINKRKEQIEACDELVKSLFYHMFGDPVRNLMNWNTERLDECGVLERGKSKHRPRNDPSLLNGPYPLIQTGDVAKAGLFIREYKSTYSEIGLQQSRLWPAGTLCITIAANIAKTGVLTFDACFPDSVVGFIENKKTNKMFIQIWMSFLQKIIEETAPESAQKNINLEILGNLRVICPPIELQNRFAEQVQKIEHQKQLLQQSLIELENNFNALMQRAFKGELF